MTCLIHETRSSQGRGSNDQLRGGREARGSSLATRLNRGEPGAACGRMPSAPRGAVEYTRMRIEVDGAVSSVRSRQIWSDLYEECPLRLSVQPLLIPDPIRGTKFHKNWKEFRSENIRHIGLPRLAVHCRQKRSCKCLRVFLCESFLPFRRFMKLCSRDGIWHLTLDDGVLWD